MTTEPNDPLGQIVGRVREGYQQLRQDIDTWQRARTDNGSAGVIRDHVSAESNPNAAEGHTIARVSYLGATRTNVGSVQSVRVIEAEGREIVQYSGVGFPPIWNDVQFIDPNRVKQLAATMVREGNDITPERAEIRRLAVAGLVAEGRAAEQGGYDRGWGDKLGEAIGNGLEALSNRGQRNQRTRP